MRLDEVQCVFLENNSGVNFGWKYDFIESRRCWNSVLGEKANEFPNKYKKAFILSKNTIKVLHKDNYKIQLSINNILFDLMCI